MDANLQGPLKELAEALHRAIEDSSDVESALAALRATGFAAVLLLEVTVALSKEGGKTKESSEESAIEPDADEVRAEAEWVIELPAAAADEATETTADAGQTATTPSSDKEFLRSLRIRID